LDNLNFYLFKGGTAVWFREPQNALPPGVEQIGNNLIIKNARPEISGNYVCVLYTATGQVKEVVFINVRPDGLFNLFIVTYFKWFKMLFQTTRK